jgi:hypothetical protein
MLRALPTGLAQCTGASGWFLGVAVAAEFARVPSKMVTSFCVRGYVIGLSLGAGCWLLGCGGEQTEQQPGTGAVSFEDEFVNEHNKVRAAVTAPANYPGTFTALPDLVWADALATSATAWANHLKSAYECKQLVHEQRDPTDTSIGENVAGGYIGFKPTGAVKIWADEHYDFAPVYVFDPSYGHYTQIVWRDSIYLGCGLAQCSNGLIVFVCRYSPAGNVEGEQPY